MHRFQTTGPPPRLHPPRAHRKASNRAPSPEAALALRDVSTGRRGVRTARSLPDPANEVFLERRVRLRHLYVSQGHNFRGRHGRPPGRHPITEVVSLECVAGRGIIGDRYFDYKEDYKGQITFFDWRVYHALCRSVGAPGVPPSAFRRNVVVAGADLNELIGRRFELDGVRFFGTEECRPCYWMDRAVAAGAEEFLTGRGGLRARILSSGLLLAGSASLKIAPND